MPCSTTRFMTLLARRSDRSRFGPACRGCRCGPSTRTFLMFLAARSASATDSRTSKLCWRMTSLLVAKNTGLTMTIWPLVTLTRPGQPFFFGSVLGAQGVCRAGIDRILDGVLIAVAGGAALAVRIGDRSLVDVGAQILEVVDAVLSRSPAGQPSRCGSG